MQAISVGCDAHKHYSQLELQEASGQVLNRVRIDHSPGAISSFFSLLPGGTPVALESVGNYRYWIADEIEAAGRLPLLTNPAKAKLMMGHVNKTDKLDANGLTTLLRVGSLPTVWLPPAALRDQRELPRTRSYSARKADPGLPLPSHAFLRRPAVASHSNWSCSTSFLYKSPHSRNESMP